MTSFLESLLKGGATTKKPHMPKRPADQKRAVWEGKIPNTPTGLTKKDLMLSKAGQVISIKKHFIGKRRYAQMVKEGTAAPKYKKKRLTKRSKK